MNYAIILTGGKQYQVSIGTEISVDKLLVKEGDTITFDQVLLMVDDQKVAVGTPTVKDTIVTAKILKQEKGPKIRTAIYKAKSRHRRVRGHRQLLTRVKIVSILKQKREKKLIKK